MSLTPETIAIVQKTAPVVAEHAVEITNLFYKSMFENDPEVLRYFNKSHQKEGRQQHALAQAVIAYAKYIDKLEVLGSAVAKIAQRHVALSIKPEHYGIVHKNLMQAIGEVLGDAVTPEIGQGWSDAVLALAGACISTEEDLYKANEARQGGWRYEREFVVAAKTTVAEDTVKFEFAPSDGYEGGFEYTAGQYVTVRCPELGEKTAPRHYTLTSKPGSKTLQIIQRLVEGGVTSSYMQKELKVGDQVLLGAPCGVFVPNPTKEEQDASEAPTVALVSAGIGETPMLAFLQSLGTRRVKAAVHVDKTPGRHPCREVFEAANLDYYEAIYTNKKMASCTDIAANLVNAVGRDAEYYISGPLSFMAELEKELGAHGCRNVSFEVFGTGDIQSNRMSCPMKK